MRPGSLPALRTRAPIQRVDNAVRPAPVYRRVRDDGRGDHVIQVALWRLECDRNARLMPPAHRAVGHLDGVEHAVSRGDIHQSPRYRWRPINRTPGIESPPASTGSPIQGIQMAIAAPDVDRRRGDGRRRSHIGAEIRLPAEGRPPIDRHLLLMRRIDHWTVDRTSAEQCKEKPALDWRPGDCE